MRIYLIYDMFDNELFIMRGTARAIAKTLNVDAKKVRDYARTGSLIKRRYRVVIDEDG